MVQSNKVLTVSYGTFSCTLEGFEDSFETMKAIAEYFRDLAADDRYFGAEPPQPDAEMLARIAEREIARQVEARREGSGIVLRAARPLPGAAVAAPPEAGDGGAGDAAAAVQPSSAPRPEAAPESTAAIGIEPAPQPAVEDPEPAHSAPSEGAASQEVPQVPETTGSEAPSEAPETLVAEPVEAPPQPAPDSIAAKLARIRAVVARNEQATQGEPYDEDDGAPIPSGEFTAMVAEDMTRALDADAPEGKGDAPAPCPDESAADAHPAAAPPPDTATSPGDDAVEGAGGARDELPGPEDSLFGDLLQEPVEGDGTATPGADEDGEEDQISNVLAEDAGQETGRETATDTGDGGAARDNAARVFRVKRDQIDAAIAAGELKDLTEDTAPRDPAGAQDPAGASDGAKGDGAKGDGAKGTDAAADALTHSSLSPEEEADLMRELAAVEADFIGKSAAPEAATVAEAVAEAVTTRERQPAASLRLDEDRDRDVARLLDEADEKLSDPEAAARHEAYDHMRAAVATTRAERMAGGTMGTYASDDPYREDLASVVRPHRPGDAPEQPPARPPQERQAPLRLVAEQRVDTGAGIPARGVIRPRRVSSRMIGAGGDSSASFGSGFAEYAAQSGARELPELLEAAAAYLTFVEGRDQFSRPQLMSMVQHVTKDGLNREDGLRAFGQLLRDGKIERRGGGRFSVSGEIGFRPDRRATG